MHPHAWSVGVRVMTQHWGVNGRRFKVSLFGWLLYVSLDKDAKAATIMILHNSDAPEDRDSYISIHLPISGIT